MQRNNLYVQIVLMLIYSGVRVSELLDLKRENVHIDEHYFNVVESKTENGIRIVPIVDKTYSFSGSGMTMAVSICCTLQRAPILTIGTTMIPTGRLSWNS